MAGLLGRGSLLAAGLLLWCLALSVYGKKTECYIDDEGDKTDPNNIYKCALTHTCCREEGKNSCCQKKESNVAMMEQVQLWSILGAGILILALVMWFCRHDGDCCCNAKDGRKSCCGKAYGKKPEDKYVDESGIIVDADGNVVVEEEKKSKPFLSEDAPDAPQTENKEKTPPSPTTNLAPAKDLPPSYSNLELDELP